MSLYDAIAEVTEEETKKLGDIAAAEKVSADVEIPEDKEPDDKPPATAKGTEKGAAEPEDKTPKAAPADKGGKKPEDEAKKSAGEGVTPPADEPMDAAAFARLRREKAAAERRAEAAEKALKPAPTQPQPGPAKAADPAAARAAAEPDQNLDPEAHLRWELQQTREQLREVSEWKAQQTYKEQQVSLKTNAIKAFESYEQAFVPTVPDYKEVTDFGIQAIKASIQTLNPNLKGEELGEAIQRQVLRLAAQAEQQGHDPAEYLYHQAKSWGYQPKAAPAAAAAEPEAPKKADLRTIKNNQKKGVSSMAGGGRNGNAPLSREAVLDKSFGLKDFAKLTPGQLRELESMEG